MKKALLAIVMMLVCITYIMIRGQTYTVRITVDDPQITAEDLHFHYEPVPEKDPLVKAEVKDGYLEATFTDLAPGRLIVDVMHGEDTIHILILFGHPGGLITYDEYFGACNGMRIIPIMLSVYIAILLYGRIRKYIILRRQTMYSYQNVRNLGLILFLCVLLLEQLTSLLNYQRMIQTVSTAVNSARSLTVLTFPFAFFGAIYLIRSNVTLLKKEGRTWRNMLGIFLGILLCFGTLAPGLIGEYLQRSTLIDVHNENGFWLYAEIAVESLISAAVAYLECILIGTIIHARRAAKAVPSFDRDYILILGCQIREDGGLTKLLQSRVDRALKFAKMQKEKTGKDIVFVPSGGKGDDEVIAEAEAMNNYLLEQGIAPDHILVENRSVNTYENFRNSLQLIKEHSHDRPVNIAFSTTNYHVFRSGVLARGMGIDAQGIGAATRSYFWINAFIREFVAVLNSEKKLHARIIALIVAVMIACVWLIWFSATMR